MKRMLMSMVLGMAVLAWVGSSWAGMINGKLEKIEGEFYVLKDKAGKEHKIHVDATTQKEGEVKAGAMVEVDEENGHAKSIKVQGMKK